MKLILGFMVAMGITCSGNAMDVRTLDKDCNYIEKSNGIAPTYREALTEMLLIYENVSTDTNKQKVVAVLSQAIDLFGQGPRESAVFEQEYMIHKFNYTFFKTCKDWFFSSITKKGFPFPYRTNAEAQKYVHDLTYFDIDHALLGILQYNAYQTTGGDS